MGNFCCESKNNQNSNNIAPININKEDGNIQNIKQVSIEEGINFLTKGALVSPYDIEKQFHYIYTSGDKKLVGPASYQRYFMPPIGWTAIALKASKKYDSGDDKWLNGEWYIGYHGVKEMISINNIMYKGFRQGPRQDYKDHDNINPLTNNNNPFQKCGVGVYFAQDINDAKYFTEIIPYSGNNYRVVFMCRLNPNYVRIANRGSYNDYMIINGDYIDDMFGTPKINEVRPYKILLMKE